MAGPRPLIDLFGDWGLDSQPGESVATPSFQQSKAVLPPPPEGPPRRRRSEPSLFPLLATANPLQEVPRTGAQSSPTLDLLSDAPLAGQDLGAVGNPFFSTAHANGDSLVLDQSNGPPPGYPYVGDHRRLSGFEAVSRSFDPSGRNEVVKPTPQTGRSSRSLPVDAFSSGLARDGLLSSQGLPRQSSEQSTANGLGSMPSTSIRSKSPLPPLSGDLQPSLDPSSFPLPSPVLSDSPHFPPSFGQTRSEPPSLASSRTSFNPALHRSSDFALQPGGIPRAPAVVRTVSPLRSSAPASDSIDDLFATLTEQRLQPIQAGNQYVSSGPVPSAAPKVSSNPFDLSPPADGTDGFPSFHFGKANPFYTPSSLPSLAESVDGLEGLPRASPAAASNWEDQFDTFLSGRLPPGSSQASSAQAAPDSAANSGGGTAGPSPAAAEPSPAGSIWKVLDEQGLQPAADQDSQLTVAPSFKQAESPSSPAPPKVSKQPPVFVGRKGGPGAPTRSAVNPNRPTCIELRPAPLRGSKADQQARTLACTETAVWAAVDGGLKVWDVTAATAGSSSGENNVTAGDEDAAAFTFLAVHGTTKVLCLSVDFGREVVWSGHSDGKARAWPMGIPGYTTEAVTSTLIWTAHKSSVTAICVTPYGDVWTGSEGGNIKCWPSDACARAITQGAKHDHTAAQYMQQAGFRVKGKLAGDSNQVHSEVRFLMVERMYSRVWSGGQHSVALWDARTHTLVRVVGTNIQNEFAHPTRSFSSREPSPIEVRAADDEGPEMSDVRKDEKKERKEERKERAGFSRLNTRSDRSGGGAMSFLRKSRDAVLKGAAAMVSAAGVNTPPGGPANDPTRLSALVASADGLIWGGYADGRLVQWDWQGNKVSESQPSPVPIRCMWAVGLRIWIGYADGRIHILNGRSGKSLAVWRAHSSEVTKLAQSGEWVFSLAARGGIRGWSMRTPNTVEHVIRNEMAACCDTYTRSKAIRILAGTWNVNEQKATPKALNDWIAEKSGAASVVVIGLQEVEMGAGSLASSLAKETVGLGLQEKGSAMGQWWLAAITAALGPEAWEKVASRQMASMLVGVWVRRELLPYSGEFEYGAVACGFGRALGNKGAVGVRFNMFRRTVCFVNSHFAAHMDAVSKRNEDYEHIARRMVFGKYQGVVVAGVSAVGNAVGAAAYGLSSAVKNAVQNAQKRGDSSKSLTVVVEAGGGNIQCPDLDAELPSPILDTDPLGQPDLSEADLLIWLGDFNYRIDNLPYEEVIDAVREKKWDWLLANDQLRMEMAGGRAFQGMCEAAIDFPPTYKFDKNTDDPMGYDSSEKKRIPAWCDRILFRDSFDKPEAAKVSKLAQPVRASVVSYEGVMDINDSDHKPVRAELDVDLAVIDEAARRRQYGRVLRTNLQLLTFHQECNRLPDCTMSDRAVIVDGRSPATVRLTNHSQESPCWYIVRADNKPPTDCDCCTSMASDKGAGFPSWLKVRPAAGIVPTLQSIAIEFEFARKGVDEEEDDEPSTSRRKHSWWANDEKDMSVSLVILVRGPLSSDYVTHRVCVCHGPNAKRHAPGRVVGQGRMVDHGRPPTPPREAMKPPPAQPPQLQDLLSWD